MEIEFYPKHQFLYRTEFLNSQKTEKINLIGHFMNWGKCFKKGNPHQS